MILSIRRILVVLKKNYLRNVKKIDGRKTKVVGTNCFLIAIAQP